MIRDDRKTVYCQKTQNHLRISKALIHDTHTLQPDSVVFGDICVHPVLPASRGRLFSQRRSYIFNLLFTFGSKRAPLLPPSGSRSSCMGEVDYKPLHLRDSPRVLSTRSTEGREEKRRKTKEEVERRLLQPNTAAVLLFGLSYKAKRDLNVIYIQYFLLFLGVFIFFLDLCECC